jgi:hypothetical protein
MDNIDFGTRKAKPTQQDRRERRRSRRLVTVYPKNDFHDLVPYVALFTARLPKRLSWLSPSDDADDAKDAWKDQCQ